MKLSSRIVFCCTFSAVIALSSTALALDSYSAKRKMATAGVWDTVNVRSTFQNLKTAFWGESNEVALYTEFGKKADAEGYGQVASTFRAVARAEQIHADQKASMIRQMGSLSVVDTTNEHSLVGSTKENLEFAMTSETYENDVMYPRLIEQARQEQNSDAEQVFKLCMGAEPYHRVIFQQTLRDLDGYRGGNVELLVCPKCGATVRVLHGDKCPVCSTPKEEFEKVK